MKWGPTCEMDRQLRDGFPAGDIPEAKASSDAGHTCTCAYLGAEQASACSSVCCHLQPPVLVNIHRPHYSLSSPAELKIARAGWRRSLPGGPLGAPPPRGRFPSFLESWVCHWPVTGQIPSYPSSLTRRTFS